MGSREKALTVEEAWGAAPLVGERRSNARLKVVEHVRIRRQDCSQEEMGTITNLSRDGLNFIARSNHYQVGMNLRLILPYAGSECVVEVVRIHRIENGRLSIGVRILSW